MKKRVSIAFFNGKCGINEMLDLFKVHFTHGVVVNNILFSKIHMLNK